MSGRKFRKVEKSESRKLQVSRRGKFREVAKRVSGMILGVILAISGLCSGMVTSPMVFADDPPADSSTDPAAPDSNCVKTSILGDNNGSETQFCADASDGNGGLVIKLLRTIVDVLTVGVGILGVIGIVVVGLQYLTAGGSEEKTRTAKRRMFEIVVGLIAYVLIYAILRWLLPTFGTT